MWFLRRSSTVILLSALLLSGCSFLSDGEPPVNILLITVDTLRADRLGCYGYGQAHTPRIDALAGQGVLFETCISPSPLTLPAHASILTGTHPIAHGARDNSNYRLSEEALTLAEVLGGEGYSTAAFVSSFVLDAQFGVDQGFSHFDDAMEMQGQLHAAERRAESVTESAVAWIRSHRERPFFLWVHYFDPHAEYDPPGSYGETFRSNPYDGEIAYTDEWIGTLLDAFKEEVPREETLVILTSDHGEGLMEHREKTHGIFLYDTTLKVPLLLSLPGTLPAGKRVGNLVSLTNLFSAILELAGVPEGDRDRSAILELIDGRLPKDGGVAYSETVHPLLYGWSPLESLRTAEWKYIHGPAPELFQVNEDPRESRNLYGNNRAMAKKLALLLKEEKARSTPLTSTTYREISPEAQEKLKSLGYLTSGPSVSSGTAAGDLPDPKDMIDLLEQMSEGRRHVIKGDFSGAKKRYYKILERNPRNWKVHVDLGSIFLAESSLDKAQFHYQQAIDVYPAHTLVYRNLAAVFLKKADPGSALGAYDKALELDPRDALSLAGKGKAMVALGRFQEAFGLLSEARELVEGSPALMEEIGRDLAALEKNLRNE